MTTGANEYFDSTTSDVWFPEMWSAEAIIARPQRLVLAGLADRRYEKTLKYGDIVNINNRSHLTAQTKAKSTNAALVYETVTDTQVQLTVATWEYSGIAVETIVDKQAMIDLMTAYAPEQGYALDLAVDDVLAGLIDDFTTNTVGAMGQPLTYDEVLDGIQYLNDANAPQEGRYHYVSPATFTDWCKDDRFIKDSYGDVHNGPITDRGWLGYPCYQSTNVEGSNAAGHDNAFIQKSCFALVMQMTPRAHKQFDIDYLCDKIVLEQLYGTRTLREDHGVWMKGL